MRSLECPTCLRPVYFENHRCLHCGTDLGFDPSTCRMVAAGEEHPRCANAALDGCNWVVSPNAAGRRCRSCALTRTRPPADDEVAQQRFVEAEAAKRRLVVQLIDLGLPLDAFDERVGGLGFDLLSSRSEDVVTGHHDGIVTIDLAEADDAHRERIRSEMGEAYRTLLGHFRHEVGHWYWNVLVRDGGRLDDFRRCFGDERADYRAALDAHYGREAPVGWEDVHVSAYATAHPWEDWAETFAHYLHLRDTLQTATEFGVKVGDPGGSGGEVPRAGADPARLDDHSPFDELAREWIALARALNALNRSMGAGDLYPFVLAPAVIDKLAFVDSLVRGTP